MVCLQCIITGLQSVRSGNKNAFAFFQGQNSHIQTAHSHLSNTYFSSLSFSGIWQILEVHLTWPLAKLPLLLWKSSLPQTRPLSHRSQFLLSQWFSNFFFFVLFRALPVAYGGSQARGQVGNVGASLHHSSSLTHWARPGIEPVSSRMLIRFISAEPRQELLVLQL